ncbi:hypothetical protein RclHR1_08560005 [Rhizophagus clarus]|uniref:Uncharacterized protein n=1 Tax=Rhizophagus clarus TaxID=94130 RepID=A0A2Z6SNN8_9GLOM|nr:hypothetical protein RclHR1_08560005 [Rhizophagus clarus]GES85474.1 hypothetical protein RCL_jg6490.t1 [Rhizophagus clarus]
MPHYVDISKPINNKRTLFEYDKLNDDHKQHLNEANRQLIEDTLNNYHNLDPNTHWNKIKDAIQRTKYTFIPNRTVSTCKNTEDKDTLFNLLLYQHTKYFINLRRKLKKHSKFNTIKQH